MLVAFPTFPILVSMHILSVELITGRGRTHIGSSCGPENDFCICLCQDALDALVDMREYDVPYHMRFQIDTDVRCGHWFTVSAKVKDPPGLEFLRRTGLLWGTEIVCSSLSCFQVQIATPSLQ